MVKDLTKAFWGPLCLGILATVLAFGTKKLSVSIDYQDTIFLQTIEKDYFEESVEYKFEDFGMAFSVADLETETPIPDYERFVYIEVSETISNGNHAQPEEKLLSSHKCSQDELNTTFENVEFNKKKNWEQYQ